ncbi:hypothetical protein [Bacillus mycoides]|uniref:hypothetical protein n=1 Tax=Bacillus mycoides TaxID=1405 RepID=UPI002930B708|nr:hypothetical protein [Bacillus mycoides]WOA61081.1 hypothetical protein RVY74_32135 [Bacillus mycoides]
MFREKTNWKRKFLTLIIIPIAFCFVSILLYFGLFSVLQSLSSFFANVFKINVNAEIIKSTNSIFGAMLVAIATIIWNFAADEEKNKDKRQKKKCIKYYILQKRFDKIGGNVDELIDSLLNQNLNNNFKKEFKKKFDEIKKLDEDIIEMIIETENRNLYKKTVAFFETIYFERSLNTKDNYMQHLTKLDKELNDLRGMISVKVASYVV